MEQGGEAAFGSLRRKRKHGLRAQFVNNGNPSACHPASTSKGTVRLCHPRLFMDKVTSHVSSIHPPLPPFHFPLLPFEYDCLLSASPVDSGPALNL